jgi:hypothetical protein
MGCGCNKSRLNNRTTGIRSGLVSNNANRQSAATTSNNANRQAGLRTLNNSVQTRNSGKAPKAQVNNNGITSEKRKIQALRREAILKKAGKI